jgi:uncharacterized membrane protein YphA (DoxX/SURF4 family)
LSPKPSATGSNVASEQADGIQWKLTTRIAFRVGAIYVLLQSLHSFDGTFSIVEGISPLTLAGRAVPWIGQHVFRMQTPLDADTSEGYLVANLLLATVALVGGLAWSVLDRRRPHYRVLDSWLRVWVRFVLAGVLFQYGWVKVYPMQFRAITRADLVRPLGDLTPVKLMWRFMAASKPYTMVAGCMEVAAGVMLLIPGLTELGALLCLVVMSNVAIMDWAYNVVVKILPVNLVLMTLYLCAPQLLRVADVLVLNRPVAPSHPAPLSRLAWVDRGGRILLGVLGAVLCVQSFLFARTTWGERQRAAQTAVPLQGIWQVDAFSTTGGPLFTPHQAAQLKLAPGDDRWLRLIFDQPDTVTIQTINGALDDFDLKLDLSTGQAKVGDDREKDWTGVLTVSRPAPDQLGLRGVVNGASLTATMHRMDEASFPLRDESLHLVHWDQRNSSPYGR